MDRVVLLLAETNRRVPLAPSLLLQYWLAVSMQPGSYQLQVRVLLAVLILLTHQPGCCSLMTSVQ